MSSLAADFGHHAFKALAQGAAGLAAIATDTIARHDDKRIGMGAGDFQLNLGKLDFVAQQPGQRAGKFGKQWIAEAGALALKVMRGAERLGQAVWIKLAGLDLR